MERYINTWNISREKVLHGENHFLVETEVCKAGISNIPPLHNHIFTEIELIAEGSCTQNINGHTVPCKTGSLLLMFPHDVHGFTNFTADTRIHSLCFADDVLPRELLDLLYSKNAALYAELTGTTFDDIRRCFEKLLQESKNPRLCGNLLMKNSIAEIVISLLRQSSDIPFSSSAPALRAALPYIRENFKEPLSLNTVAKWVHLSPQYFCKLFKSNFNISFHEYLRNMRLDYAMMLLTTTEMNVTEVCLESGFRSFSNFTKVFRDRYDILPKDVKAASNKGSAV